MSQDFYSVMEKNIFEIRHPTILSPSTYNIIEWIYYKHILYFYHVDFDIYNKIISKMKLQSHEIII